MYAALADDPRIIEALLSSSADIEAKDDQGYTPLLLSVVYGKARSTDTLLARGAKVGVRNKEGQSVLDCAKLAANPAIVNVVEDRMRRSSRSGTPLR
jgi:ankyrin repeat protein